MIRNIYILLLLAFGLSQGNSLTNFQNKDYTNNRFGSCISESRMQEIQAQIKLNIQSLKAQGKIDPNIFNKDRVQFSFPLQVSDNYDAYNYWGIWNFVDQDQSANILDYNCRHRTYNGHEGTDFFIGPFPWQMMENESVEIVAAADGMIVYKEDFGIPDNCLNQTEWNAIHVLHLDNSIAMYGHIKQNSLTDKEYGEFVSAGEYLGIVGSSGWSPSPHLHLVFYKDNFGNLIDPYSGECNNLNDESRWIEQTEYWQPTIFRIVTHDEHPNLSDCDYGENINERNNFIPGETVLVYAYYRDMLPSQVSEWRTYRPDGQQVGYWEAHLGNYIDDECYWQGCYLNDYVYLPNDPSSIGTWLVQIEHEGEVYEHTFNVQSLGDMNNDGSLNVIDIVMAVDLILNDNYDLVGDVNEDGTLDVLDLVILVNWILFP